MSTSASLPCPIAPYVPQTDTMCLLDRIVAVSDTALSANVTPDRNDPFVTAEGIPGWVCLEWMAQAIAAWAGWHADGERGPVNGFLLGTRRFTTETEYLAVETTYRVDIELDFQADNGLGHFRGMVKQHNGTTMAHGTLTAYQAPIASDSDDTSTPSTSP
ncbi:hypothetical protein [Aidingimonas halophila]|nr:hypothetical protein [Aidingimonas halophila]GHC18113.1 hypothetical protein GCM10008094_04820 [Aidingimonas halophila]